MAKKYLDDEGLRYLWTKIKPFANVQSDWNATEGDAFIKNKPTIPTVPSATTTTPKMDGTAAVGTETKWAKGDHVHPSDTSRVPTTRKVNGKALSADVNLYFADVKTSATDTTTLATALGNKVDKVTGKGLSTNDYTTAEKDKLANIEAGAEENVLEGVQVNGTDLTITDKKVNVPVFTGATTSANGTVGLVPAPEKNQHETYLGTTVLSANGTWGRARITPSYTGNKYELGIMIGNYSTTDVELSVADSSHNGLMSNTDKDKLDSITMTNGVIDSSVLPSFVDDVIEAYARANQTELGSTWLATGSATGTVITPEAGVIYVLMNDSTSYSTNTQFRWGGTSYIKLNDGGVSAITNAEIDTIVAS